MPCGQDTRGVRNLITSQNSETCSSIIQFYIYTFELSFIRFYINKHLYIDRSCVRGHPFITPCKFCGFLIHLCFILVIPSSFCLCCDMALFCNSLLFNANIINFVFKMFHMLTIYCSKYPKAFKIFFAFISSPCNSKENIPNSFSCFLQIPLLFSYELLQCINHPSRLVTLCTSSPLSLEELM